MMSRTGWDRQRFCDEGGRLLYVWRFLGGLNIIGQPHPSAFSVRRASQLSPSPLIPLSIETSPSQLSTPPSGQAGGWRVEPGYVALAQSSSNIENNYDSKFARKP